MRNLLMKTGYIMILFGVFGLIGATTNSASAKVGIAAIISIVAGIFFINIGKSVEETGIGSNNTQSINYVSKLFVVIAAIIKALSFCWLFILTVFSVVMTFAILNNSTNILEHLPLKSFPSIEKFLFKISVAFIPPIVFLIVIWFIEKAIYGYENRPDYNNGNGSNKNFHFEVLKWFSSVLAGVVSGFIVWLITK